MRFKNIYNETKDNVESSMLSLWTPGRHRMRAALKDLLAREPIMAEPIFQSKLETIFEPRGDNSFAYRTRSWRRLSTLSAPDG